MFTKLAAACLLLTAAAAPAFAQGDNDIASKLREGRDYSRGTTYHRHASHAARRPRGSVASSADTSADQLNQRQLARSKP